MVLVERVGEEKISGYDRVFKFLESGYNVEVFD